MATNVVRKMEKKNQGMLIHRKKCDSLLEISLERQKNDSE